MSEPKITKLFIDLEDVLKPLEELGYEEVGRIRARATKAKKVKVLIIVTGDVEVEQIERRIL